MINATEFARRRRHLMELIGSDGVAVLAAAPERVRNRDSTYPIGRTATSGI
jgi:Xaa-Pro aminopeptidase